MRKKRIPVNSELYDKMSNTEKTLVTFLHKFTFDNQIRNHNVRISHSTISGSYVLRGKLKSYEYDNILLISVESKKWNLSFIPSSENEIELFKIEVNDRYRKSGVGTEILNLILDTSDELNIGLKLLPYSFDTEDTDYLKDIKEPEEGWNSENLQSLDMKRVVSEYKKYDKRILSDTYFLKDWYRSFGFKSNNPILNPYLSYEPQVNELKMVG